MKLEKNYLFPIQKKEIADNNFKYFLINKNLLLNLLLTLNHLNNINYN